MTDNLDITVSFHKAAELVKTWGTSVLPDGMTIEQALTIEGISFWSAISSVLAFGDISQVLSRRPGQSVGGNHRHTFAQKARLAAFDIGMPLMAGRNGCKPWPNRRAFLFLGFSHHMYRETLQPVAVRLARRADCPVVVLDERYPYQAKTGSHGEVFHSLWQHWDTDAARTKRRALKGLKAASSRIMAESGLPKIVPQSGLEWGAVHNIFDRLLNSSLPRLVTNAAIALHIMKRHRPALLISPDVNDPRARIFCLAGKLEGIKTLEIQFGVYGTSDIEWRFFIADHLAVTGDHNLHTMLAHGIARDRMTVTGSPRYDSALTWASGHAQGIRKSLSVADDKLLILFASQPYYYGAFSSPGIRHDMIRGLFNAASRTSGMVLLVKPHPLEDPAELRSLARGMHSILIADKHLDIRELIKASDAFITFFSNTAFDALVMNKPTINLAYPGGCASTLIEESGATFVAKNDNEISSILNAMSTGRISEQDMAHASAREIFLHNWLYRLDGRSAERIESLALAMA